MVLPLPPIWQDCLYASTPCTQATAAAQERQQLAEERADAEAAAKRAQQAQQLAQQRTLELEARVQVGGVGATCHLGCPPCQLQLSFFRRGRKSIAGRRWCSPAHELCGCNPAHDIGCVMIYIYVCVCVAALHPAGAAA